MRKLTFALIVFALAHIILGAPTIDPNLRRKLQKKGTALTILISFKNSKTTAIRDGLVFPQSATRADRASATYSALKSHADETQANVLRQLTNHRSSNDFSFRQLWITNQVAVKKADLELVEKLLNYPEISTIAEEVMVPLLRPVEDTSHPEGYVSQAGEQWGVAMIEAPAVWSTGVNGSGIVLASIDTGVRGTHEALRDGYRSLNGWYDPVEGYLVPTDKNGHGTHTMGTMVGRTNGIGVAPGATWISCKGCGLIDCPEVDLIDCGQWAVCPTEADGTTNPRCDLAPHAVSNSWGGSQEDYWYNATISTWIKAGIVPVFGIGNNGPSCRSTISPGDNEDTIAVGAISSNNQISSFSSVGPTNRSQRIKPDVAAPGSSIYSAIESSDTAYGSKSGTSMATPHVTGLVGLLLSQRSDLTVDQIRQLVTVGSQPTTPTGLNCGGINETTYPNHHVGAGRISAKASVDAICECRS